MYAHITLMRHNGKALDQHQIRSAPAVRGHHRRARERDGTRAGTPTWRKIGDGQVSEALLPALYDCRLAHMSTGGFGLIRPSARRVDSPCPGLVVPARLSGEGAGPRDIKGIGDAYRFAGRADIYR